MVNQEDIIELVADVLQLGQRAEAFNASTLLLGSIPEFDSMAVVSVITAIEENFGITVDDDEVSAELFESLGSLHNFVLLKLEG